MKKYFFLLLYGKIKIEKLSIKKYLIKRLKINKGEFINLYKIFDGRIYTDCKTNVAYIKGNKLIQKISYQQNKHSLGSLKYNSTLQKGTPAFKKKIIGRVFSLVQGASGSNYFHWLFDILPKIEILHKNDYLKNIDFFYVPMINNFILKTLRPYGIKKKQLINSSSQKHIEADEILTFEHLLSFLPLYSLFAVCLQLMRTNPLFHATLFHCVGTFLSACYSLLEVLLLWHEP